LLSCRWRGVEEFGRVGSRGDGLHTMKTG
jgi:hypothetical protein